MKRLTASMLAALLLLPGCALHVPAVGWDRSHGPVRQARIVAVGQGSPRRDLATARDAAAWRRYVEQIPVGSRVKARTVAGHSVTAIFMGVEGDRVLLNPRTRIPEPIREVAIADLASIEIDNGTSVGKTVGIAAAVAAGTVLGVLLILVTAIDD
jgi:hypothetical protein